MTVATGSSSLEQDDFGNKLRKFNEDELKPLQIIKKSKKVTIKLSRFFFLLGLGSYFRISSVSIFILQVVVVFCEDFQNPLTFGHVSPNEIFNLLAPTKNY